MKINMLLSGCLLGLLCFTACDSEGNELNDYTHYVNPFIGTGDVYKRQFLNLFQHCLSGSNLSADTYRSLVRELCSGIGGHDKYNMAAVRFPSFVIRQDGIVHDLSLIHISQEKDLVFIIPTKKARSARKGNENKSPKLRQSR